MAAQDDLIIETNSYFKRIYTYTQVKSDFLTVINENTQLEIIKEATTVHPEYFETVDLTGYNALMHIKKSLYSTEIVAELSTENGLIRIFPETGQLEIYIPSEMTASFLSIKDAIYDLILIQPDGQSIRSIFGNISIITGVTQLNVK